MSINWSAVGAAVAGFLQQGAALVESPGFQAIASAAGPEAAAAAKIVGGLAEVSEAIAEDAQGATAVLAATDLATIQAADAKIQQANIALAQQIASS